MLALKLIIHLAKMVADKMISEPKKTVYVNRLNERVKQPRLKRSLKALFSKYGMVEHVIMKKGLKYRGQCWVVFEDVASAERAVAELDNLYFYNTDIVFSCLLALGLIGSEFNF